MVVGQVVVGQMMVYDRGGLLSKPKFCCYIRGVGTFVY